MLRRPATVISLANEDLLAFDTRSDERIVARKAQEQRRLLDQQQQQQQQRTRRKDLERTHDDKIDSSMIGRSGKRKKLRLENEAPSRGASGTQQGKAVRGGQAGNHSLLGYGQAAVGMPVYMGTGSESSPSYGRRGAPSQARHEPPDIEGQDPIDGMDLDADVPDGDLDLDADIPDLDASDGSDEEKEEEEEEDEDTNTALDTSNIDVEMSTPSAPARGGARAPAAPAARSGTPTASSRRNQPFLSPAIEMPEAATSAGSRPTRATTARQTRGQQAPPPMPQPHMGRRMSGFDGANDDYDYRHHSPPLPPWQEPQYAHQQERLRRRHGSPQARHALADHHDYDDDEEVDRNQAPAPSRRSPPSPPPPPPPPPPQLQQPETEMQRRRRIIEETDMVRVRERARRARILGVGGVAGSGRMAHGQGGEAQAMMVQGQGQGMMPPPLMMPPPPPSYGGVPGAPVRAPGGRGGRR